MTRFRYTALSLEGSALSGEIEADDDAALATDLGRRGLMLVSLKQLGAAPAGDLLAWPINPRTVTSFLGELALVLRSGMRLDEALDVAGRGLPQRLSNAVALLRSDIIDGSSFVQALERRKDVFSEDIVAMARVAEVTGDLDGVIAAIAAERERGHRLNEKVQGALRYPAFLICSAAAVLLFFLIQVIPQFSGLFRDSGKDPGFLVSGLMAVSRWLVDNGQSLALGAAMMLATALLIWRIPTARAAIALTLLRLPVIHGVATLWLTTRLLSNLAVLVGQGVALPEALAVLGNMLGVEGRTALASTRDAVRRGGRLHEALGATGLLPAVAVRMVRIGEETGELAKVASEAGALYGRKLEKKLEQIAGLIGPVAILSIAGLIGGLMVTIMSALISINDAVQ
ncbi:MAG TPA: type II secretion system F family protein [Rhodopseudomonas sp.]|uniref:type II secretion system F family protein n=1 Tax=Rhodopseudomonas sp. TaxID=1078 RepID=UPI002EDA2A09